MYKRKRKAVTEDAWEGNEYQGQPSNSPENDFHQGYRETMSGVSVDPATGDYGYEDLPRLQQGGLNPSLYSAPVGREGASMSYDPPQMTADKIRLTAEQAEVARKSGIDLKTYAEGLLRLQQEKRDDYLKYRGNG